MATLEKIRNKAGILVIAIGVALFAFIIGDLPGKSYFGAPQDQVAEVEGVSIHYAEYQRRINEMTEVYRMQMQGGGRVEDYSDQIRQNVYNSFVQEIILNKTLEETGMKVTPEELFDMIQGEHISPMVQQIPLFADPQTGVFSKTRALNVLKTIENIESVPPEQRAQVENIRNYWLFWERNIKQQRLQNKYITLLSKAIVANPLEAKNAYEGNQESSDIVYAMQSYSTIPDSLVTVSDNEAKKLYDQRKDQYKQKDMRVLDYIAVEIRPSEEDYENVRADIENVKTELATMTSVSEIATIRPEMKCIDAFMAEKDWEPDVAAFVSKAEINEIEGPVFIDDSYRVYKLLAKTTGPDSVKVSHILLAATQTADTTVTAKQADSLLNVLKTGGNFEELAALHSADQQSAAKGGDIGWLTETMALSVSEAFKQALFSALPNQPFALNTSYGTHVIRITERTSDVPKYKAASISLSVTASTKTSGRIYNELNQFLSKNNTVEKITAASKEAGYNLLSNVRVTTDERVLGSIDGSREVIRWAFDGTGKNEVSKIFDCTDHYVVAIRLGALPEGYQSFASVAPMLKFELTAKKKGEEIVKRLKEKNLQSIEAYAEAMQTSPDTVKFVTMNTMRIAGIGLEPILNAEVTVAPERQLCGPVIGNNGVYVFTVINRTKDSKEYNEQEEIRTIESMNAYRAGYQTLQALTEKAKITDRRIRFE
ncbi:MAG: SurA N-terminal domain-containing protein [Tannerella sp.]|jgi:peptidyl-prolyl cis-trans isomerase D|nr:SurA N-terminal domain-containing protein [Tannerella sp.]